VRVDPDQELVQRGAYRFVRHPSYAGVLLVVVGMTVMFGSSIAGGASAVLLVAVYRKRIALEETALESALGGAYRVYRRRTWCLLPGIW
jgi:protein-S-isoprenylcysteine O-methyltransferase